MDSVVILVYLSIVAVGCIIGYFFLRYALSVNTTVKLQKAQTDLLIKIAEKQGVSKDEIDGIRNTLAH